MTVASMNRELQARYAEALRYLRGGWQPLDGDSKPMLIEVPITYAQAPIKLMVVGQEAGGWAESVGLTGDDVDVLMRVYRDFALGRHQRSTPFWQGARKIFGDLNGALPPDGFLWSNLVKVDVGRRRPPAEVEAKVASLRLLEHEVAVTRPDAVIFFTGPRYDDRLKATFPEASIEELGHGTAHIHNLPFRAVRTYHPRYLRQSRQWAELDRAVALLAKPYLARAKP